MREGRVGRKRNIHKSYVITALRGLKFLDSREIEEHERKEAFRIGHLCLPARPDPSQYKRPSSAGSDTEATPVAELPQDLKQEGVGKASFGLSNYVYYGRQSEVPLSLLLFFATLFLPR